MRTLEEQVFLAILEDRFDAAQVLLESLNKTELSTLRRQARILISYINEEMKHVLPEAGK